MARWIWRHRKHSSWFTKGLIPRGLLIETWWQTFEKLGGAALVEVAPDRDVFHLPAIPSSGLAILEILPAQILSVALARLHSHIPGQFSLGSKVTNIE
jgi:hypothetical protein